MPVKLPETIIFDLDGTLVDTAPDLTAALNAVLIREGLPIVPLDQVRHMVGRGARVLIESALTSHGISIDPDRTADLMKHFLEYYEANIAETSRPFDGVEDQLHTLSSRGHKLGVCTNKPEALSLKLLTKLGLKKFFPVVLGLDSKPYRKPDPRHLIDTVAELGGNPLDSVMIGDSETDAKTAQAASIPVILVSFGYSEIPIRDLTANVVIDHFDSLQDALAKCARA